MDAISYQQFVQDDESKYKVTISKLGNQFVEGGQVTGVLTDSFAIAGQNQFSSLKNEIEDVPLVGSLASVANKAAKGTKLFAGKTFQLELEQTRKVWQESGVPNLSINLAFYGLKSGDIGKRPIDKVKALYAALFPRKIQNTFLLDAPLGYKWIEGKNLEAAGTLSLTIGQWFLADKLVAVGANFTPSLQVMRDGSPLYISGSIELEPYKMITYDEFLAWFPERPSTSLIDSGNQQTGLNDINLGVV
jgi:hypothetical protein